MKKNVYRLDRYTVSEIEEAYANDQADTPTSEVKQNVLNAAIDICRERARLYVMPAQWEAKYNPDGTITVTRYHN